MKPDPRRWIACIALLVGMSATPAAADSPSGVSADAAEAIRMIESDDTYQHQLGFMRLEALREPATVPFVRAYLRHEKPELRAASIRALAAIEGLPSIPDVIKALTADRDADVRRAALLGIEPFEPADPRVLPAMLTALRDRDPDVRITAVDAVSRVEHGPAREAILDRNRREGNRNVRRALTLAMKRLSL